MKMSKTILAAALAVVSGASMAADKGDWFMHARVININPNDDSSVLNLAGSDVAGTGVEVNDATTLGVSIGYMLTDNFALDLLLDPSTQHDVSAFGLSGLGVPDGTEVVNTNVLPPTLFAQYHFNPQGKVRPYAGVGLNYTLFFNDDLTDAAQTVLGASNLDIDSSFGLAGQFGIDFEMKNGWYFNVDVKYIKIDTTATFDTALGAVSVDVDIDPTVVGIGFGKTF
jgi:outer membrane protein